MGWIWHTVNQFGSPFQDIYGLFLLTGGPLFAIAKNFVARNWRIARDGWDIL
jgi:hypothetical protein